MDLRLVVRLHDRWLSKCRDYCNQVIKDYDAGLNERSRSVSYRGAEKSFKRQFQGRCGEVAAAIWLGLDPLTVLNWSRHCDAGFDIFYNDTRIDVKATEHKRLIWSVGKLDIFEQKAFDILWLVIDRNPDFHISGWISKNKFRQLHSTAGEQHPLDAGTWYVDRNLLTDPQRIRVWEDRAIVDREDW